MNKPRKLEFIAFMLPVLGLLAIMPPLVSIRNVPVFFFGIPSIIAYLFGVWFLLILGAYLLQRLLPGKPPDPSDPPGPPHD